ncbi:MAG: DUF2892 domain-containing protein [Candidatus Omnitrophota bacterium]
MVERLLRGMSGFFILVSLALAHYLNPAWLWFTVFVGANLLQSAFTNWCPAMLILKALGIKSKDKNGCC